MRESNPWHGRVWVSLVIGFGCVRKLGTGKEVDTRLGDS